jgi:hypothetical protein
MPTRTRGGMTTAELALALHAKGKGRPAQRWLALAPPGPMPSVTDESIESPFLPSATKMPATGPTRAPRRSRS